MAAVDGSLSKLYFFVMNRHIRGFGSVVMVAVLLLALLPVQAFAATPTATTNQPGFNIITSPLPIKLNTAPGRTVTSELRMKNLSTQNENIKVGLMKFGATGDQGKPNLFDLTPKDTYASWVHFSPSTFVAEPNVWKTVTMTINVPKDASLGYYLAVTFSRAAQPGATDSTNLRGSVATLVLLAVNSGNEKRDLKMVDFTTDHGLYEYLPVNFNIKLRNQGNIYLAPTGNIFIQRGSKAISTITFNQAGGSVLPGSNRVFSVKWESGFPLYKDKLKDGKPIPGKDGQPQRDLKWDFTQLSKFRIGKYTAKLLVVYDNGTEDVPMESSVSFWVLPWKLILVGLVILAIIGFGLFTMLRSMFRGTKQRVTKLRKHDQKTK